jgi:hypothetical protein
MVGLALLAGTAVGVLVTRSPLVPTTEMEAALLTGLSAVAVSLVATIVAVWTLLETRSAQRAALTLEHISRYEGAEDFEETRRAVIKLIDDGNIAQWATREKQGTKQATALRTYINAFELQAIAVESGAFDERIYKLWNKGTVTALWRNTSSFVNALRVENGRDAIFKHFELLAKRYGA